MVVRVEDLAGESGATLHVASVLTSAALLILTAGLGNGQGKDGVCCLLGSSDEIGAGVGGYHAGEDGGISNE